MPAMGMAAMRTSSRSATRADGLYEGSGQLESGGTWQVTILAQKNGQAIASKQLSVNATGGCNVISRWIDWCARNRFLVFTGTLLLVLAGIWSLRHIPLDALPDISDVQVIVHTPWEGEPPNIIEDQVTYPIVTTLLAAPHVKAVRAQTMFGDSYVFVVFEDGTDLYWARSRVLEYMQQITGRLPAGVHPVIGPDATGAGWVYEYALVDHSHQHSLADLAQPARLVSCAISSKPFPASPRWRPSAVLFASTRCNLDPNKLRAYGIPLSTVIDSVRASTNEVGGRVLEMGGAEYMIRGLGYLRSLSDLETSLSRPRTARPF